MMLGSLNIEDRARAFPASDARQQPPVVSRSGQGVPWKPRPRIKKLVEINKQINIGTWNVGSMTGRGRELVEVFKRRNIKIACVQETKWSGKSTRVLGEGYKIYYSGETNKRNGVGIILDPTFASKVIEVKRIDDRIMRVKLVVHGEILNIISAYAPQAGVDQEVKEDFMEKLEELINETPTERIVIGADLNGHVGKRAGTFGRIHGSKGFGDRNEEGERILECAESLDLAITNTFFEKREEHLITYKSGNSETQIDYILVRKQDLKMVKNCKVIPGEEVVSQHRLLCVTLHLLEDRPPRKTFTPKIKIWKLNGEGKQQFKTEVQEKYKPVAEANAEDTWKQIQNTVMTAAEKVCGKTTGGKAIEKETWWWNEDLQDSIKEKKKAFRTWQRNRDDRAKEEYRAAKRKAKAEVARAKEEAYSDWYEILGTKEGEQQIYRVIKQRAQLRRDITDTLVIKDKEGQLLTEEDKVKARWKEYFSTLLNTGNEREPLEDAELVEGPEMDISRKEVSEALKKMKSGKSPGCSGVTVDLFKKLEDMGVDMVCDLLNKIWREERIPSEWEESEVVPIYKQKGDPLDCANYRGIKLLEHLMKLFERIIDLRLRKMAKIDNMQFGFTQGRGTTDAVFIVSQLQEKFMEKRKNLYFAFVDLEKAYDRVPRDLVYWSLRKKGITEKTIRVIKATYHRARTTIRSCYGRTEMFPIEIGLHQGSALSPFLFVLVLDAISKNFREGLPMELLFADDLVVMADTEDQLQERWQRWQIGMEKVGLKVNTKKTEVMVSSRNRTRIKITDRNGEELNQVDKFKYLGTTLSEEGGSEMAVRARITAAWNKWRQCSGVLYDRKMPRKLKVKIYNTVIRPVLTYGAETWVMRKKEERLIQSTEMRMLRRIKGITKRDREKNENIRRELGVPNIVEKVREARLRWFGHLQRAEEEHPAKTVMNHHVHGNRGRGRPKKRWRDNITEDMKMLHLKKEDAEDRTTWRARIRVANPV